MFNTKQNTLIDKPKTGKVTTASKENLFVKGGLKKAATTTSLGNGAVKFTTTGNDFVDEFGKVSQYKAPRSYADVDKTMRLLWSQSPEKCMKLLFYIRLITRQVVLPTGTKTESAQRGQGLRHEGILRMIWVAVNHPDQFWENINLFVSCGSWKDIIQMLSYDLQYNGWNGRVLDWTGFGELILAGLENPNHSELIKKYLPQIKSNTRCTTLEAQADNIIAKWICSLVYGVKEASSGHYRKYRKLKTSGTAHEWQKLISQHSFLKINFNSIHGRALSQLVSGKFLKNAGLEAKYEEWISAQPVAKYTGFVYELITTVKKGYQMLPVKPYQRMTFDKQFLGLVETAKKGLAEGESGYLVVGDTSSSMTSTVAGTQVSAYSVMQSLALFFSYLLKGPFADCWMEFNDKAELKHWKGTTPYDRLANDRSEAYGGTNFQSVTKVFCDLKRKGVPESDFPCGIIAVSDGCFNNSGRNMTETKLMKQTLLQNGFSKDFVDNFKICIWDVPNGYYGGKPQTAFEEFADCPNLFYMSGLDGSAIAFLTGTAEQKAKGQSTPKNAEELFEAAMDQELLNMIVI